APRGRAWALNVLELGQSEKRQLLSTWGMSLNCLNVLPLAIGHRLSRMAVKGFARKACRLGIDTFDVPLLSKWVQHIGECGRTPKPLIAGSNPATCARLDRTI